MALFDEAREEQLEDLFKVYRQACGDPDGSPAFMPGLWERIEARRRVSSVFRRLGGSLVTAAAMASLILFLISTPKPSGAGFYTSTYLEVLAVEHAAQSPDYAEPVSVERDSEAELLDELL